MGAAVSELGSVVTASATLVWPTAVACRLPGGVGGVLSRLPPDPGGAAPVTGGERNDDENRRTVGAAVMRRPAGDRLTVGDALAFDGDEPTGPIRRSDGGGGAEPGGTREEALRIAEIHGVRPLLDGAATADAVLSVLAGASLAHLAVHGRLVHDNPLFSDLPLADGPLVVYDLERLAKAPHTVVLAACDSG